MVPHSHMISVASGNSASFHVYLLSKCKADLQVWQRNSKDRILILARLRTTFFLLIPVLGAKQAVRAKFLLCLEYRCGAHLQRRTISLIAKMDK